MPITNIFLDDQIGILRVGEGILTANEDLGANNEVLAEERPLKDLLYMLVDLTHNTFMDASSSDIERIARSDSEILSSSKNVVIGISAPKEYIFGLARMWEAYSGRYEFHHYVFKSLSDTEDWLISKVKEVHGVDITRPSSRL